MTTNPISPDLGQSGFPKANVLGVLFFLLGAPHLYASLRRRAQTPKPNHGARYVLVALLAAAIAGVAELSLI